MSDSLIIYGPDATPAHTADYAVGAGSPALFRLRLFS